MRRLLSVLALVVALPLSALAAPPREVSCIDEGWRFALGNAADPLKDFGCGTEYFNYLTKAASIHNTGPYAPAFDDSDWQEVDLPHDWAVDLPFAAEASHSHGYKTLGWKYPETSVGWYRRVLEIPAEDFGRHIALRFDGIFRDSRVWINGFYLGGESSGYAGATYDVSEYLNYGGSNVVCVRADASLEEGWFYEGAGIYRHVWLEKTDPVFIEKVHSSSSLEDGRAVIGAVVTLRDDALYGAEASVRCSLLDREGRTVAQSEAVPVPLAAKAKGVAVTSMELSFPRLWSCEDPYLYTLRTRVYAGGELRDETLVRIGIRTAVFDPDRGFLLNGQRVELRGANLHQDAAGVGVALPDALHYSRLGKLASYGFNAIRASHNPLTPEVLDACDSLGFLVIEENRLMGINDEHKRLLAKMIDRDVNHPSIILWSIGNEEWGIEWNEFGTRLAASMTEFCHRLDPSRPVCVASSGGPAPLVPTDIAGYNYILQNPVEQHRSDYPLRRAIGTEETSGCGSRGIYFDDRAAGRMAALNRSPQGPDSLLNCIERGWKFYEERPWLGGLFFWTGFDYRGEPNPLEFPATGSEFGILDYCGFPKDEAWYLKSWWTNELVLHVLPHWNLSGHEGGEIAVWVYSNCDEVLLRQDGRSLGRKKMPRGGHLEWKVRYRPGKLEAIGYKGGKKVLTQIMETSGPAAGLEISLEKPLEGSGIAIVNVRAIDEKGRFVPDAEVPVTMEVSSGRILGAGNGDPAFRAAERPSDRDAKSFTLSTFSGCVQFILSGCEGGSVSLSGGPGVSFDIGEN